MPTALSHGSPCPECGWRLTAGRLQDYWGVRFIPIGSGLFRRGRAVGGYACTSCGFVSVRLAVKGP